jgi:hypothetical protein
MERETGIEPATNSLEGCDSTIELLPRCSMSQMDTCEDFIHSSNGFMYPGNLTGRLLPVRRRLCGKRRWSRGWCGCGSQGPLTRMRLAALDQSRNVYREWTPFVFPQMHRTHFDGDMIVARDALRPEHSVVLRIADRFPCLVILRPAHPRHQNRHEQQPPICSAHH